MIIQCGRCQTRFYMDEVRLKPEGSKVRCGECTYVFMAYPSVAGSPQIGRSTPSAEKDIERPQAHEDRGRPMPQAKKSQEMDFDRALGDVLEESVRELEGFEAVRDARESREKTSPLGLGGVPEAQVLVRHEAVDEDRVEEPFLAAPEPRPKRPRKGRFLSILLILLLLAAGGLAGVIFWAPERLPEPFSTLIHGLTQKPLEDAGGKHLTFESVKGGFVDSHAAGRLFVIRGFVKNAYPKPRGSILIKANLLDDKGSVVKSRSAFAGNPFSDEDLKGMPFEEIRRAMGNSLGKERSNVGVEPGKSIPFAVVFEGLPASMAEFTVEGVSSSPDTQVK